jgi:hypothetical protein
MFVCALIWHLISFAKQKVALAWIENLSVMLLEKKAQVCLLGLGLFIWAWASLFGCQYFFFFIYLGSSLVDFN